jgi:hypothetical protein
LFAVRRALECDILTLEQVGCSSLRSGLAFDLIPRIL